MNRYLQRIMRAIKLDASLYEEVETDKGALPQAMGTVVLASVAAGFTTAISGGFGGWILNSLVALIGWYVWAFLTFFIGTRLLPENQTASSMGELLRTTGFSAAPGLFQFAGIIPGLGIPVRFVASVWMLVAFVVAVRQALDYASTWRAVGVCFIGWVVMVVFNTLLFVLTFGRLTI